MTLFFIYIWDHIRDHIFITKTPGEYGYAENTAAVAESVAENILTLILRRFQILGTQQMIGTA